MFIFVVVVVFSPFKNNNNGFLYHLINNVRYTIIHIIIIIIIILFFCDVVVIFVFLFFGKLWGFVCVFLFPFVVVVLIIFVFYFPRFYDISCRDHNIILQHYMFYCSMQFCVMFLLLMVTLPTMHCRNIDLCSRICYSNRSVCMRRFCHSPDNMLKPDQRRRCEEWCIREEQKCNVRCRSPPGTIK